MPLTDTDRALDLFVKLMRARRAVIDALAPSFIGHGLTPIQFGVTEALLHKGPLSHGELKRKVLTSAANLTDVIDKLEARGLVTRRRASADGRRVEIALTESGRAIITAAFPVHAAAIARVMGHLDVAEQAALASLLRKLGLAADREATR